MFPLIEVQLCLKAKGIFPHYLPSDLAFKKSDVKRIHVASSWFLGLC